MACRFKRLHRCWVTHSRLHITILITRRGNTDISQLECRYWEGCLWSRTQTAETIFILLVQERRHGRNEDIMKKANNKKRFDELRPEYDLAKLKGGVRGKYAKRFKKGTNLVLLSPDVAKYFPDEQSVNAALRSLVSIAKTKLRRAN